MRLDPEDLRRHYASLSDEGLLELERADLTELAQRCYDEELSKRRIVLRGAAGGRSNDDILTDSEAASDDDPQLDWLEDAACACSFDASPGNDTASNIDEARHILESAGIPCHAVTRTVEAEKAPGRDQHYYELMVPAALNLRAVSILDKEFFNPQLEAEWRTHFAELSDEELRALSVRDLTVGMMDRVERLTNAYNEELAQRNS